MPAEHRSAAQQARRATSSASRVHNTAEQVAGGETVLARLPVRGTFAGPRLHRMTSRRPATVTGTLIVRFADGQLVGLWLQAPPEPAQATAIAEVWQAGKLLAGEDASRAPPWVWHATTSS